MSTFVFDDLHERQIVGNWNTLNKLIDERGFPPGRIIGRRRIWTEREVLEWLEAQPTDKRPPRGRAKELAARKAVRL